MVRMVWNGASKHCAVLSPAPEPRASGCASDHGFYLLSCPLRSDWGGLTDGNPAAATLTTTKGEKISADLVFKCVGVRPATALYAASLQGPGQLSRSGAIAVEPTLQASACGAAGLAEIGTVLACTAVCRAACGQWRHVGRAAG